MKIYYDNYCPNCTRFAQQISKLDWLKVIEIKQLRNLQHINEAFGIDKTLAEKQMASYNGQWNYGYKTLFLIFLRIPICWFFIPLFWLLDLSQLGQYLYLHLAVNRQIIPFHCSEDSCEVKYK
ncbi:DUF393 domain-containing protein [Chryseobacterium aahli]|uniref:DCC1-like thiol-disulfide oxidoreductase family protein n=1 Tax=Chryseobacterium aahli TaxID=1278643 RepID=UPI001F603FBE|nr:DCC1-like thiol-disulfide oxidoreductase family protein [Chryseobacterium aahli]MCI3938566.1 DUF393 domain-containing protein [Chryseobacterium aahli]